MGQIARVDDVSDAVLYLAHPDQVTGEVPVRRRLSRDRLSRFPGMEPLGDYPLHSIVKRGTIILPGVLDSEADKTVAGLRAREVAGSFGVENDLVVENMPVR